MFLKSSIKHRQRKTQTRTIHKRNDSAFQMAASNIKVGVGATKEVGYDFKQLGAKHVAVFLDPFLSQLKETDDQSAAAVALKSLEEVGVKYSVYDDVRVEPTDVSFKKAIDWCNRGDYDAFLAVGGGSTMDTAKAANLYTTHPTDDFLDYVNPPIGKGKQLPGPVKPCIAIPTTAGTGSETTGVTIFDLEGMHAKTGIANRFLKPTLGIVDPLNTVSLPANVVACTGFDVLCHALESYTALPYHARPDPASPLERPAYQGSNHFWVLQALKLVADNIEAALDPTNIEAKTNMILASTYAGIGFGNAGVHLCHGMSYPVSGNAHSFTFQAKQYPAKGLIPHGILPAPSVFKWTGKSNPDRHLEVAKILGADITQAKSDAAGDILANELIKLMNRLEIPNGLNAIGYTENDIPELVKGTLPQHRVTKLSPIPVDEQSLEHLFKNAMTYY